MIYERGARKKESRSPDLRQYQPQACLEICVKQSVLPVRIQAWRPAFLFHLLLRRRLGSLLSYYRRYPSIEMDGVDVDVFSGFAFDFFQGTVEVAWRKRTGAKHRSLVEFPPLLKHLESIALDTERLGI